jgi:hypothetical protein
LSVISSFVPFLSSCCLPKHHPKSCGTFPSRYPKDPQTLPG